MAFDLVQYFAEQIKSQKPQLLSQYSAEERCHYLNEINTLSLGRLISLWRKDEDKIYQEIHSQDPLYIQEISRHLTTSKLNQSELAKPELEQATSEVLSFQLSELKQLDETGNYKQRGMRELLLGQIEHLSGQAKDWVWSTNELNELIGSQPIIEDEISLDQTMKEFNQMVSHVQNDSHEVVEPVVTQVPTWSIIVEPAVAIVILAILYCALQTVFS